MVNFIKISSLIIILLFFPISFYFNIIPINCDSENNLHVEMSIDIYPEGYGNSTKWYAEIYNLFLENNSEPLVIEDIDWGELNRNGNIFYVNILIKKFRNREKNEVVWEKWNIYELGILEEGNYSFIVYVNDKLYETKEFRAYREIKLGLQYDFSPWLIWNGEEWIASFKICSNMIPKGIHWGPLIRYKDEFLIDIDIDEWTGTPTEYLTVYEERNYSLGILEEGNYTFYVYVNNNFNNLSIFSISRTFITYVPTIYTTTETCTIPDIISSNGKYYEIERTVTETRIETQKLITTTIKVKEKTTTTKPLITKTIETKIKEKFEIENFIPLSLFIIVIMITILLYYILFKRREI
jgi:hypothetical protein